MQKQAKQVIVVRKDLNMTKGKIAAQVAHASMGAITQFASKRTNGVVEILFDDLESSLYHWLFKSNFTKICVGVNSEKELMNLWEKIETCDRIVSCLITDSGKTMFNNVPTVTCFSILGWEEDVNQFTGGLKLL